MGPLQLNDWWVVVVSVALDEEVARDDWSGRCGWWVVEEDAVDVVAVDERRGRFSNGAMLYSKDGS